jgi:Tol biopolymer transport system component
MEKNINPGRSSRVRRLATCCALAAPLATFVIAQSSGAAVPLPVPGPDGVLAFRSDRTGNDEIFTMSPDGSDLVNVTRDAHRDWSADISLDGMRIVFVSDRTGSASLWIVNTDGTGLRRLTTDSSSLNGPSFSPDGSEIAYVQDRHVYIRSVNADPFQGGRQVTDGPTFDYSPDWSPDGSTLAFERLGDIFTVSAAGVEQGVVQVTTDPAYEVDPAFSPDGRAIAYAKYTNGASDIYTVRKDFRLPGSPSWGPPRNLTNDARYDSEPAYSPTGQRVVYTSSPAGGNLPADVFVMSADGTKQANLTAQSTRHDMTPSWGGGFQEVYPSPVLPPT